MPQIKITVTPKAQADLVKLHAFIAQERPESARKAVQKIISAIDNLKDFPEIGREHSSIKGLRFLYVDFGKSGYAITYRYATNSAILHVLNVKHGKENK